MEFMGYHIVDITIVALIAFLAIKGLVNGFTKELLNLIIVAGGVILASRYNTLAIKFIEEQNLFPKIPEEFTNIVGFILIIVSVWIVLGLISSIITKLTAPANGFISRLLGYLLSGVRYVFIFSLIIFGVNQSEFFKESATKFNNETKLFKPMAEIGAKILNREMNQSVTESSHSKEANITSASLPLTENNNSN